MNARSCHVHDRTSLARCRNIVKFATATARGRFAGLKSNIPLLRKLGSVSPVTCEQRRNEDGPSAGGRMGNPVPSREPRREGGAARGEARQASESRHGTG